MNYLCHYLMQIRGLNSSLHFAVWSVVSRLHLQYTCVVLLFASACQDLPNTLLFWGRNPLLQGLHPRLKRDDYLGLDHLGHTKGYLTSSYLHGVAIVGLEPE